MRAIKQSRRRSICLATCHIPEHKSGTLEPEWSLTLWFLELKQKLKEAGSHDEFDSLPSCCFCFHCIITIPSSSSPEVIGQVAALAILPRL
jgi:hypothetical protein